MLGDTFANDLLQAIFNAQNIANLLDNAASSPLTNLYISLHTADPGDGGSQTTSEANYTGYARLAVARTSGGWTVSGRQVSNAALAAFVQCSAGTNSIIYAAVGTLSSGAGKVLSRCPLGIAAAGKAFTAVAATDTLTIPGNILVVDDRCVVYDSPSNALAAGLTEGTLYWVKSVSGNDVTLSNTQVGATLDITAAGGGIIAKVVPLAVAANITPQFAAGQLLFKF